MTIFEARDQRFGSSAEGGLEFRQLSTQIYDRLREQILRGELLPGASLVPRDLAARLGVSITPVRNALSVLAADGLIVIAPRKGTVVTPFSADDIWELFQIRLMVEPEAARAAAVNLDDRELRTLGDILGRLEPISSGELMDRATNVNRLILDAEFHSIIVRGARNHRLDGMYQGIQTSLIAARANFPDIYPMANERQKRNREHRAIYEALVERDGDLASERSLEHLLLTKKGIFVHMSRSSDNVPVARQTDARTQVS